MSEISRWIEACEECQSLDQVHQMMPKSIRDC